jgi:hypothetical protein
MEPADPVATADLVEPVGPTEPVEPVPCGLVLSGMDPKAVKPSSSSPLRSPGRARKSLRNSEYSAS